MSEDSIALTVYGVDVTARQRDAALAVMVGEFKAYAVGKALIGAGVPWFIPGTNKHCAAEVAYRLLQWERKAGRIFYNKRKWCRTRETKGE